MKFKLATWNINSVRTRLPLIKQFVEQHKPDILCLQEIKCQEEEFPHAALQDMGFAHIEITGQKAYHGVAIASRHPLEVIDRKMFCDREDARHISVSVDNGGDPVDIHNFYVPAGGDVPDTETNWKFAHKLAFIDEMGDWLSAPKRKPTVIVGDLNIAPLETDVWSHKQLLKVVSHTPAETESFEAMRRKGGWVDLMRHRVPADQKLYTWWSYRAADWQASDRGRRLDHVWSSPNLVEELAGIEVLRAARGWPRPSDHVPVIARFAFG